MESNQSILNLSQRIKALEEENITLRKEIEYLKTHPTIAAGIKGETLIMKMVDGEMTKYAEAHDITIKDGIKIEVKYSKLNVPNINYSNTKRWTWSKPLGWKDKGKDYDYLLLVGEKDKRYFDMYLGESPYVFFLIPYEIVSDICVKGRAIGANINLTTKLDTGWSGSKKVLLDHMVHPKIIEALGRCAIPLGKAP